MAESRLSDPYATHSRQQQPNQKGGRPPNQSARPSFDNKKPPFRAAVFEEAP
jgi:hypothetical protein